MWAKVVKMKHTVGSYIYEKKLNNAHSKRKTKPYQDHSVSLTDWQKSKSVLVRLQKVKITMQ